MCRSPHRSLLSQPRPSSCISLACFAQDKPPRGDPWRRIYSSCQEQGLSIQMSEYVCVREWLLSICLVLHVFSNQVAQ